MNVPPLLKLLQDTVSDARIFPISAKATWPGTTPDQFREECRRAFADLYEASSASLTIISDPESSFEPGLSGAEIFNKYQHLSSCWIESYHDAVWAVAARKDLVDDQSRAFLFFMAGYLFCGMDEHFRQRRRDSQAPAA